MVISKDRWQTCPEGSMIFSSRDTYGELSDRHESELTAMPSFHCMSTNYKDGAKCQTSHWLENRHIPCLDYFKIFKNGKDCFSVFNLDIPGWCWAWPGPPSVLEPTHHVHTTSCATPQGKLWATCCCLLPVLPLGHPQRGCSSQLIWWNKF